MFSQKPFKSLAFNPSTFALASMFRLEGGESGSLQLTNFNKPYNKGPLNQESKNMNEYQKFWPNPFSCSRNKIGC